MKCTTCSNEAIINQALGKSFYYCRTCKVEVVTKRHELEGSIDLGELTPEEQQEFEEWLDSIKGQNLFDNDGAD